MTHANRVDRLRAAIDAAGLDALVVSQPESRYYLSGYTGYDLPIIKDAAELAQLQEAIDVLDRCLADVLARIEPGMTEKHVATLVELYLLQHADGPSFPSIVASGPNASVPHAVPSERRIKEGEVLKIDIGARAGGYCSDMTRTVCLGEPRDPKLAEIHAIVLEAPHTCVR